MDAWLIQEMISELKPDLVVETGTYRGGSAFFFASIFDLLGHGQVITIDVCAVETIPHDRITYIRGSSIDEEIVARVRERAEAVDRVLFILDSDHSAGHVRSELEIYAPIVSPGSYIHIQDGCIDELPIFGRHRGPKSAAKDFLRTHPEFVRDVELEHRFVLTAHPYGWLRRVVDRAYPPTW